ncbi:MAG: hypothetical protein V1862_07010 [Methanobacteriota archaeon]
MVQTSKKKYVKPVLIDISLEGITGIGASTCSNGPGISDSVCSTGTGATSSCTTLGYGVSNACLSGGYPFETGTLCRSQGLSAAACNANGGSASQGMSRCIENGSDATYATPACCNFNGDTNTSLCWAGSAYIPSSPSGS